MSSPRLTYTIRDAEERDLPGILDIVNEQIANATAIFEDEPLPLSNREKWFEDMKAEGRPIFVAVPSSSSDSNPENASPSDESLPSVLGYTYYSGFRAKTGYRYTAETTLYIHHSARGKGIGKALLQTLINYARGRIHTLIACTSGDNHSSIAFHEKLGFVNCGTLKQVGLKFGEWQDTVYLQLFLEEDPRKPAEIAVKTK